jgi:NAD(P)H dehydrogenase (quinone)
MHALLVYAHPEPSSFTGALKGAAFETLRGAGHAVEVSDLYGEGFNPVAGRHDFVSVCDPRRFHYQTEQGHAHQAGTFAPDIVREQQRFLKADLVVWLCPIWWGGVPAILKGWFERVLAYGFAYTDGRRYDSGFFQGKSGLLCLSTGGTEARFSPTGVYGSIDQVLWPTQRLMVEYLGIKALEPFMAYAAPRVDQVKREAYLQAWRARLLEVAAEIEWQRSATTSSLSRDGAGTPEQGGLVR